MSMQDINLTDADLGEVTGGHIAVIGAGLFAAGLIGGAPGDASGKAASVALLIPT